MSWKNKNGPFIGLLLAGLCFMLLSFFFGGGHAAATAGTNQQLSFEGKLVNTNGTNIADGTYNVEFKIYQDGNSSGTGSTLLWTEDYLVAGSTGMPSTGGVALTSGTFQVNLGSVCTGFAAGSCGAKTNAGVDFNQQTLWLSVQVGNTSACTVTSSTTSFNTACGGDGEMTPYIRLTAVPQAQNANLLDGIDSTAFGQLASNQTWTGTNTIQPTTNITGLVVKQTSVGSPTQDILDVQTANNTNVIQVTGPSANNAAVLITSVGTGALTLQSGTGTISLGTTTAVNASGALAISSGGTTQTLTLSTPASTSAATGAITIQSGNATVGSNLNAGTITVDTGTSTGGGTAAINIGTANAKALTLGNTSGATALTLNSGTAGLLVKGTNSSTALQVQNSSAANILTVNTSGGNANNLVANPSFETTISGSGAGVWVIKQGGAGTPTIANNTSQFFNQLNSAKVVTTANASDGIKQQLNTTLTASTAYNVIFYSKLDAASATMSGDLQAGYSSTGASDDIACTLNQSVIVTGWTKYSCTFTTPATTNSSNYFYIKQTDGVIHTFYVDAVLLQLSSTADANYRDAQLSINATLTSPMLIQPTANSTNAFTVQNASGGQVFNVDTTDTNLINNPANPSFEVNTAGWAVRFGGGTTTATINRDTSQQKFGVASLKITSAAQSGDGARYTLASGNWATGNTTVSFSMLNQGTAFAAVPTVLFGNGSDNACAAVTPSTIPSTSGWTRYAAVCNFSGSTNSIVIAQNEATAHTFYIDAVQVEVGSVATVYGLGAISISGQIITPTTFKNQSNSATAFQVQNTNGDPLIGLDTTNTILNLGETGSVATASTVNVATSTGATQTVNLGSAGTGNAAAGTLINIQGGTTASTAVTIGTNGAGGITLDTGTTGSILIGGGTTGNPTKTISIGPTATNSSATAYNLGVNVAGTQTIKIGSSSDAGAAAGTTVDIQGGTTASTAVLIGTNGAGGITVDTGTTGSILIGAGTSNNAKVITIGPTATKTSNTTINIGTNAAGGSLVAIGSNNASSTFTADSGTATVTLFNTNTAHTIQIATGGAAAGNAQNITIGSPTTTTNSKILLQAGNSAASSNVAGVIVGSATADANQVNFQLDTSTATDAGTCSLTVNQGAMYYNQATTSDSTSGTANTNEIRACVDGTWQDIVTSQQLGLQLFGVVPDSGANPGDMVGIVGTGTGPCKVINGSAANTIRWSGCTAYSNGRKVIVPAQTSDVATTATNSNWQHLCLNGTNGLPTLTATNAAETGGYPAFSATAPILCIADIQEQNPATGGIAWIYDTRTFTTTEKQEVNVVTTAPADGWIVKVTTTAGQFTPAATATDIIGGVVVATAGGTTANTVNAIIATVGPFYVKAVTTGTIGQYILPSTTTGKTTSNATASATAYGNLGVVQSALGAANCTVSSDATCRGSLFSIMSIR